MFERLFWGGGEGGLGGAQVSLCTYSEVKVEQVCTRAVVGLGPPFSPREQTDMTENITFFVGW